MNISVLRKRSPKFSLKTESLMNAFFGHQCLK